MYFIHGVFSAHVVKCLSKIITALILSWNFYFLYWYTPVSALLRVTSLCHFQTFCFNRHWCSLSAVYILMPTRPYFQLVEYYWNISDPLTYIGLRRYKLTLCICSKHSRYCLNVFLQISNPAFPLTVFSYRVLAEEYLFPRLASFQFACSLTCFSKLLRFLPALSLGTSFNSIFYLRLYWHYA